MARDYESLKRRIEDGVQAAEELQKLLAELERKRKPKLRLIKGGVLGGAIWAGVEWLRNYKIAVALAATAATVVGGVIAEQPHSPGADPPAQAITKPRPVKPRTSVPSSAPPRVAAPTPRRTSPPRTRAPARVAPAESKSVKPVTTKPTVKPTKPSAKPTKAPVTTPAVSIPATPTVPIETPPTGCVGIDLLGLCILG
jgi:hypothetical protein